VCGLELFLNARKELESLTPKAKAERWHAPDEKVQDVPSLHLEKPEGNGDPQNSWGWKRRLHRA
jgi:hypothetical protein